ncbi:MAG TPA: hypothetical protein VFW83_02800 [Bryobacteraceae bacterium]|nr:hypothetical protein [Bryobacteraceae bacterium]
MIFSLLPLVLAAIGLIGTAALFLSLKREMLLQTRRHRAQMQELFERMEALKPEPEAPPAPVYPRSGFNYNKRVQALRLLRRGENAAHISTALGIPRCEVDLLIRVQRMAV